MKRLNKVINTQDLEVKLFNKSYALITPDGNLGYFGLFLRDIIDIIDDTSAANPEDLRPLGRYRIDGHHIRFECCNKVLSIVPNESDDYENLVSCPFCNAKLDGKES